MEMDLAEDLRRAGYTVTGGVQVAAQFQNRQADP